MKIKASSILASLKFAILLSRLPLSMPTLLYSSRNRAKNLDQKSIAHICVWKILTICFMILTLLPTIASSQETYVFERMWPAVPSDWHFGAPFFVDVDGAGYVYVSDQGNDCIQKFTTDGQLISKWPIGSYQGNEYYRPGAIVAGEDGTFHVVAFMKGVNDYVTILKLNASGEIVKKVGSYKTPYFKDYIGETHIPCGIDLDIEENIYVADAENHRIQKLDPNGNIITEWGSYGTKEGEFNKPTGVAVDRKNNFIYVLDAGNLRTQKFTLGGEYLTQWECLEPWEQMWAMSVGITLDSQGYVYVSDRAGMIKKYTGEGTLIQSSDGPGNYGHGISVGEDRFVYVTFPHINLVGKLYPNGTVNSLWSNGGTRNGFFRQPKDVAIDSSGNVYVADFVNGRIQKFDPFGQFLFSWQNNCSQSIAIDGSDNIYITQEPYCAQVPLVKKYNPNGELITGWGSEGTGNGQFAFEGYHSGIAVDDNGYVYVLDSGNDRIQKFAPDGQFIAKWGSYGSGDGQFTDMGGIDADNSGFVYVADSTLHNVQKFTTNGDFVAKWVDMISGPSGIAVDDSGSVYVITPEHVLKLTSEGGYITEFGGKGSAPGLLKGGGIAVDSTGRVYVADTENDRIQVFSKIQLNINNKAIIVAGGGPYPGNNLWNVTQMSANFAYRALNHQGYSKDDIYYLSSDTDLDLDNNGQSDDVDADATNANLQEAITTWASDADNLILYLIGDGDSGTFRVNGMEFLSVNDLDSWLDTLEDSISGKITVIYDAFSSGSFLPYLTPTANKNRIVITSTSPGEKVNFVSQGSVSFSSFFWTHIFNGNNVYDAFNKAKSSLVEALGTQHPLLDDTGNGIGNEDLDGTLAQSTYLGNGTEITGDAPVIAEVSSSQTLTDNPSALLYADGVTDANGIVRVWAVIQPPYYTLNLPIMDLMPVGNDRYEANYNGFDTHGTYKIAIYARDSMGNTSLPSKTTVTVNNTATMQEKSTLKIYIVEGEKDTYAIDDVLTLKANYRTSAGEDLDLTETVNWTSTNASVGDLSAGVQVMTLTFKANGKVRIIASLNAKKAEIDLIVGQPAATKHHGNLIIVAGGKPDDPKDTLKDAVQYMSGQMYKVFKARKFADEDIYYINHNNTQDFDGDGVSDGIVDQTIKTVETLKNAINWAQSQPNDGPMYLYLIDHGEKNGTFLIDTGQILTAPELDASLDAFEAATGRISIIMLDACYSGSFLEALQDTDRIVFTSSAADEYSYFSSGGDICFGQFFSNYLLVGKNWEEAFDLAVLDMDEVGEPYTSMTPQKAIGAEVTVAQVYGDFAIAGLFPDIKTWTLGDDVNADTAQPFSVELDIMDTEGVSVWALVMPPYYQPPTTNEDYSTPTLGLEKVDFTSEAGTKVFSGEYSFVYNGTYNVTYYVKDSNGIVISTPPEAFVVTGGQDPGDTITLSSSWNLLSLPVVPTDATVEEVLSGVKDNVASVWKWKNGKWAVYLPSFSLGDYLDYVNSKGFGFLTHIYCGEGFWINSDTVQTLTVTGGPPADTTCSLTSGWNLLGIKSNETTLIADFISGKESSIASIWKWVDSNWTVYLPGEEDGGADYADSKGFTLLESINPSEGFWMNCTEAVTLE